MTGEIQFMRKQIFGGFNRKDAVAYVAKIAKERNDARDANEEALKRIESLKAEIHELRSKLEEAQKTTSATKKVVVPKVKKVTIKSKI